MKIGIIGLPASGKTTLFNALTGGGARTGGYGSAEMHVGMARVADSRLDALAAIYQPPKTIYAPVDFVDVPALESSEGARSRVEAIPQPLQGTDALLLVVRAFEDPGVPHSRQRIDPARDLADGHLDLILRDLAVAEGRVERLENMLLKRKNPEEAAELELLRPIQAGLEEGRPISAQGLSEEDLLRLRGFRFLSAKPLIVVVNTGEDRISEGPEAHGVAFEQGEEPPVVLCAKLEEELAQLPEEERAVFLADFGLERPARERVIEASFSKLDLQCFFTADEKEVRAWPIRRGTSAARAAGVIHSDMERGFIRAEVISFEEFREAGSLAVARELGTLRLEGRDYEVQDGDILHIRFHV